MGWIWYGRECDEILKRQFPCCEDSCKNCETNTEHNLKSKEGTIQEDHIDDIEKYVHTILDSDDQEDIECKKNFNEALIQNREVHILQDKMEDLNKLDQEKLEEMKQKYDPNSEKKFRVYLGSL